MSLEEIKIDPRVFLPVDHDLRLPIQDKNTRYSERELCDRIQTEALNCLLYYPACEIYTNDYFKDLTKNEILTGLSKGEFTKNLKEWINWSFKNESVSVNLSGWVFPEDFDFHFASNFRSLLQSDKIDKEFNFDKVIFPSLFKIDRWKIFEGFKEVDYTDQWKISEGLKFEKTVEFTQAKFYGTAHFYQAQFQKIFFWDAVFHSEANFERAKFKEETYFINVKFNGIAKFNEAQFQNAKFQEAEFHGIANFEKTNFKSKEERANFREAKFKEKTYFSKVKFEGGANFWLAEFEKEVYFNDSSFHNAKKTDSKDSSKLKEEVSSFYKTQFKSDAYFSNITGGDGTICFQDIQLSKEARIIFDGLTLESPKIIFYQCPLKEKNQVIFRNCDMSKVTVENGTFEGFKFENCTWKELKPPNFIFFKVRSADPEIGKENFKQLEEKYASLKIAAKNSGDEQLASEFHFWQLYYAGNPLKTPFSINWFYYHVCGYGLSIRRPIIFLILLLLLSSFVYSLILNNNLCFPLSESCQLDFQAIKLSIEASTFSFDPFKLMDEENQVSVLRKIFIAVLYFLQKSISLFLLFEFGQAIRNKVKK